MELCRFGPPVKDVNGDEYVLRRVLGIFNKDVEVAIVVEHTGVDQLVFRLLAASRTAGLQQVAIGKGRLRVLVEVFHVGVSRRAVQVEIVLFHIFAVVALAVGQAKQPLLEDRVPAIPQGQGETEELPVVADAAQAILAPTIGPGAGLVVAEIVPGVAIGAIVLAHGAPLALAQVGAPLAPGHILLVSRRKAGHFLDFHVIHPFYMSARCIAEEENACRAIRWFPLTCQYSTEGLWCKMRHRYEQRSRVNAAIDITGNRIRNR